MKKLTCAVYIAVLTALFAGNVFAGTLRKEFKKEIDFISGGKISIENTNGKINVASWSRDDVSVFAEIQVKSGDRRRAQEIMDRVKIIVDRSGERLRIKADYPRNSAGGFFSWLFGKGVSVKVDFEVRVPDESDLLVESVNGKVDITSVEGDCEISTTNGSVTAEEMNGNINAHTTNGSIKIHLAALPGNSDIDLHTVNGGLKLVLPEDPSASITASTVNGSIRTDFELRVRGKFNSKSLRGTLGSGDAAVYLKTVNGSIGLYER